MAKPENVGGKKTQNRTRINDQIKIREVRLIDPDGNQIGIGAEIR